MESINFKKWFDRMQPQTLQIATWLLYFDGFFALVNLLEQTGYIGYLRYRYTFGAIAGMITVALYAIGGLLMANERKLGYKISIVASLSPFVVRYMATSQIFERSIITTAFDIAVVALLLHTQSREHQRIWYR